MSAETEAAMIAAIRNHIKDDSGKDTYGAIVVLADTTPLGELSNTKGNYWHYADGGFFACHGLLVLAGSDPAFTDK